MNAATDRRPRRSPASTDHRSTGTRATTTAGSTGATGTHRQHHPRAARTQRAARRGMTWTTYDVLVLVCARRAVETRATAVEVGIAKATLTSVLVILVDRGLVRRDLHEHDRRRVVLRPTQAGMDLARRVQHRVDAEQARLFGGPGLPPRDSLARVLRS